MVMISRFMVLFVVMMVSARAYAQTPSISDYLIMQNIGGYVWKTQSKDFITGQLHSIPGYSVRSAAGILAGANHFDIDHTDTTYETRYINNVAEFGVEVQVTQHAGGDSDRWLLHEVEDGFRKDKDLDATYVSPIRLKRLMGIESFHVGILSMGQHQQGHFHSIYGSHRDEA